MAHSGCVVFGEVDEVVFGRPAAEVVAEEARRRGSARVYLMTSATLNRTTDEVAKVRWAEALDQCRPATGPGGVLGPPPRNPPSVPQVTVPTTLSAGEFSAIAGVTGERHRVKELFCDPQISPRAVVLDPAVSVHTAECLWLCVSCGAN